MKKSNQLNHAAVLAGLLILTLGLLGSGCSRPPEDIVKQGIEQNVNMQALRASPFVSKKVINGYKITNEYKRNDMTIYDYEASVSITAELFNRKEEKTLTLTGSEGFVKNGDRWEFSIVK